MKASDERSEEEMKARQYLWGGMLRNKRQSGLRHLGRVLMHIHGTAVNSTVLTPESCRTVARCYFWTLINDAVALACLCFV